MCDVSLYKRAGDTENVGSGYSIKGALLARRLGLVVSVSHGFLFLFYVFKGRNEKKNILITTIEVSVETGK